MDNYSYFAEFYDELTYNVEYHKRALYILDILKKFNHKPGLTLDLACGTGNLTLELKNMSIDIFGVDISQNMLSKASEKALQKGCNLFFLCQDIRKLELYSTVDTVICSLDSLNHLTKLEDLQCCFERVSLFLNDNGYFIFDMNTVYKHKNILGNNVFIYDVPEVYCVWQNSYNDKDKTVNIDLDFFKCVNNKYLRYEESFLERAYSYEEIEQIAELTNLQIIACYSDMTFNVASDTDERIMYVLKKEKIKYCNF